MSIGQNASLINYTLDPLSRRFYLSSTSTPLSFISAATVCTLPPWVEGMTIRLSSGKLRPDAPFAALRRRRTPPSASSGYTIAATVS